MPLATLGRLAFVAPDQAQITAYGSVAILTASQRPTSRFEMVLMALIDVRDGLDTVHPGGNRSRDADGTQYTHHNLLHLAVSQVHCFFPASTHRKCTPSLTGLAYCIFACIEFIGIVPATIPVTIAKLVVWWMAEATTSLLFLFRVCAVYNHSRSARIFFFTLWMAVVLTPTVLLCDPGPSCKSDGVQPFFTLSNDFATLR